MHVLEVVQGLGRGGAERALLGRLTYAPASVTTTILNLRANLDELTDPKNIDVLRPNQKDAWADEVFHGAHSPRPDVIVIRTPRDAIAFTHRLRASWRGIPVVFEAHSTRVSPRKALEPWARRLMKSANRWIDLHLAVSEAVSNGPQCQGANTVFLHRLGVDVAVDSTPLWPFIRGTRFVVLGRLHPVKRPLWIAEIVRQLSPSFRESSSEIIFVGAGSETPRLERFVRRNQLQDVVKIAGEVEEPSAALASADVLLQGSRMEGLPLSIVEAKRMGLRVVTTPAGGSSEILGPGDTVTPGFAASDFKQALMRQIQRGPQGDVDRLITQKSYSQFTLEASSTKFYELIEDRFSRKRVSEFVTGPIEGGIPATIRSRLHHVTSPLQTQIIAPFAKTTEELAAPETFPCEVVMCHPGIAGVGNMIKRLRMYRPQIIIAHGEREFLYAALAKRRVRSNAIFVFLIHNDRIESRRWIRPLNKALTRVLARQIDIALAVSKVAAQGELGSLFPNVVIAVQPPTDDNNLDPVEIPPGFRFISAGRLVPAKRFDILLNAIGSQSRQFIESGSQLTIAGEGPSLAQLKRQAEELGLNQVVHFPGQIDSISDEYRSSHYFLQPSQSEGAGMALLEALRCGARAASGPVGLATEILALDEKNTLFEGIPTSAEWGRWLSNIIVSEPPGLKERTARARAYQQAFDPKILTNNFYQLIFEES